MTGTPSRAALAARNGSARVAALPRPARRDQQPAAGRRRRGPYRHRAELWPALRHRDRGTRDRRHRRGHRASRPGRHHRIRAGPGQQHREEHPHLPGPGGEPAQPSPHRRCRACPHPPSTPPHPGQASSPSASCRSTNSPSPFTVSTTPPSVNPAALPEGFAKRQRGGPRHIRRPHRAGTRPPDATLQCPPHRQGTAANEKPASRPPAIPASASPAPLARPRHKNPERRRTPCASAAVQRLGYSRGGTPPILLLSPLLSAVGPGPHLRGLPGAATAPCSAQTPPPNPIAAEPYGSRVLSRGGAADHAVTPKAPLTGSGCREHSYGGFGGGHSHFHPHAVFGSPANGFQELP